MTNACDVVKKEILYGVSTSHDRRYQALTYIKQCSMK